MSGPLPLNLGAGWGDLAHDPVHLANLPDVRLQLIGSDNAIAVSTMTIQRLGDLLNRAARAAELDIEAPVPGDGEQEPPDCSAEGKIAAIYPAS